MQLDKLSKNDLILGGVTLLLLIDLLFLPWWSDSYGPISISGTATGGPDGWAGILALLGTLALLADLAVERFSPQTTLPNWGGSRETTRFRIAAVTAAFLVLKVLLHISFTFNYAGFGFWLAVVLTILLVVGTLRLNQGKDLVKGVSAA